MAALLGPMNQNAHALVGPQVLFGLDTFLSPPPVREVHVSAAKMTKPHKDLRFLKLLVVGARKNPTSTLVFFSNLLGNERER